MELNRLSKIGLVGLVTILALGACSKSGQSSSTTTTTDTSAASPAASAMGAAPAAMTNGVAAGDGAKVYQTNCSSCHQATGTGIEGTFPPLAGNPVVVGDPAKVIHIVKYGLTGKIDAKGHSYNGMMPPWGSQLSNADIAAAITFIRSSWGNKASSVTASQVASATK